MSFEPLQLKLIDRRGNQVSESVRTTVVQAFERAVTVPDANINDLVLGAARVARVIADGDAEQRASANCVAESAKLFEAAANVAIAEERP